MAKTTFKRAEILLFSLIICNLATAKQLIRLQNGLECPEPGYFRDAVNCQKFYYCPDLPKAESLLSKEEVQVMKEITEQGLECPEGTIFDETIGSCQNVFLMDVMPPECQYPQLYQHHSEQKDGIIRDISNNH